ncbi:polysaccharide biosynthesis protein [Halorubrum aidingense JCM 13560]|uniref:Polysaccharide biosynthesis protein n=1 Tax=Halorubrum aidingense JCM 13560 TaxID=1230454 RepID=M0PG29_9EURY|nr:lipopolysaccharide biosynthesis protein [Halorubrum aidingense]EMA69042.1 polysaccharide biosynthesis protein [Halorubrum aidingense JCM 13560]
MSAREADFGLEISKGVLAKFAMAAIGFSGSVVFARVLGPSGYGAFYVIQTLVTVLDNPVTGWGDACKKRISETGFPTSEALGSGILGATVFPIVILPLVYLGNRVTGLYDLSGLFIPFCTLFVGICCFAVTNRILSARANFSAAEWADTVRSLLTTPLQLFLVFIGLETAGMVYGLAIATILTIPYVMYQIGIKPELPSLKAVSSIFSFAKYSIPNGFIGTAQSRMDILLLGAVLSSAAVGDYQVSMQLTMIGAFLGSVAAGGLMARVSDNWSQNDSHAIIEDLTNSLGYASVLAIPIFFGASAMPGDLIVTIFGAQYSGVGTVLVGLALFRVLATQTSQLRSTISGLDQPQINTQIGTVVLVLNLGLGYLLLLEYGILGVIAATIVSEIVKYTALAYAVKQYLPEVSLLNRPLRSQLLSGMVMFVVVESAHSAIGVSWWGDLTVLIGLGGIIYFTVLTAISESFRVTVKGVLSDALRN